MLIRRIARPLLATAFIATGVDAIRRPEQLAETVQPFVDKAKTQLPPQAADLIPADAQLVVRINGAVHIIGGLALATGKFPRLASLTLAGVVIPTTLAGNDFWNETDPHERTEQQSHFIKNVGLLGGLLIATVDTEGKPSLAWRGRKAAAVASDKVVDILPSGSGSSTTDAIADKALHFTDVLSERTGELADIASKKGAQLADAASDQTSALTKATAKRQAKLSKQTAKKQAKLAKQAAKAWQSTNGYAEHYLATARDRAPELIESAREYGAQLAEQAAEEGVKLSGKARKQAKKAQKAAAKLQ